MQKILLGIIGLVIVVGLIVYVTKKDDTAVVTTTTPDTAQKQMEVPQKVSMLELAENTSGNTAKIARATLAKPGYIAIYRTDADGEVTVAGNSNLLSAGEYSNLLISLDDANLKDVIVAVLHQDDGNGTFDFPRGDFPVVENNVNVMSVDVIGVPHAKEDRALANRVEAYLEAQAEAMKMEDVVAVTIHAENYKFSLNTIKVKKDQKVRVTLISDEGTHDFMVDEFKDAQTKQLAEGKSETIEFVADKKGSFKYYCSVGNHRAMGMEGTLIVE